MSKIIGITVGTTLPKPNFNQTDPTKGDYIRNKPTNISYFTNDAGYLTKHQDISHKLDASALPAAVNDALAQAKDSGEFDGKDGAPGQPGADGTDGVSPTVSVSRSGRVTTISITDKNGTKTATINDGADGTTPVRGADYWTDADQESIVQQVIAALGTPVFGRVDEENNIILTGTLADGTYTIKYESEDGEETLIGTLVHTSAPVPTYTNLANPSDSNWLEGKRINSSKVVVDWEGGVITNYFDVSGCKNFIAVKGLNLLNGNSRYYKYYEVGGTLQEGTNIGTSGHVAQSDYDPSVYHIPASDIQTAKIWRLGGLLTGTSADVIITIDEEIK